MTKNEIIAITAELNSYSAYSKLCEARFNAIQNGELDKWKKTEYKWWFKAVLQNGGPGIQGECDTDWFMDSYETPDKKDITDFINDLKKGIKWLEEENSEDYNIRNFKMAIKTAQNFLASNY